MDIKKINFTPKNGATVMYYLPSEDGLQPEKFIRESKLVPTMACQNALQALKVHLLLLSEEVDSGTFDASYIKDKSILTDSDYKKYTVEGFEISGEGEQEKVVIFGKKLLSTDKKNNVKNYKQALWNDTFYEFSGNLQKDVANAVDLFKLYLGGEHQPVAKNDEIPFPEGQSPNDKEEDVVVVEGVEF